MAFILFFAGCAGVQTPSKPAVVPEFRPGIPAGYLPTSALPNSLALIPQPPATGSTALAMDEETYRKTRAFRGTPRWDLATQDAESKISGSGRDFFLRHKCPDHREGYPSSLYVDAPRPYGCRTFHLQGQESI